MVIVHQLIFDKDVIQGLTKFKWIENDRYRNIEALYKKYFRIYERKKG